MNLYEEIEKIKASGYSEQNAQSESVFRKTVCRNKQYNSFRFS